MAQETKKNEVAQTENKAPVNKELQTKHGQTVIEDAVVSKIAGLAAREVTGVYSLGGGAARMMGSIRETFGGGENIKQGVSVEVGESQAAVDLTIIAEYGVAIHKLAEAIRQNIMNAIESMTGLEVTEVNVTITDVHVEGDDNEDDNAEEKKEEVAPRVQ